MSAKILLFILLSTFLYASSSLKETYYVNSDDIYISHIIADAPRNKQIYKIEPGKYTKKVKSKELINILKKNGYRNFLAQNRYVTFIKKSPIDTSKIVSYIKKHYTNKYEHIDIKKITVEARGYIDSLPKEYTINLRSKDYLSRDGIVSITTPDNKKSFLNYDVSANVQVYFTKSKIKKDTPLSVLNTVKKSIILDKFMAKPIQNIDATALESKHHMKKNKIITVRNVETLSLVKQNSNVNVSLNSNNMSISFSAKALQDGKYGDQIVVQKDDGTRLKVRVVGKNRVEIK
nr:flagellar basal body P-ring formation chaperone FlgA [uncultured Sulfurimonas sp.]